jgi:hypothetical protein
VVYDEAVIKSRVIGTASIVYDNGQHPDDSAARTE